MGVSYSDYPELAKAVKELLGIFRSNPDKDQAHRLATPVLEAMTHNPQVLDDIVAMNIETPGFFARTNYPVPSLSINSNAYFDIGVNCWVPLPDRDTNMSTKALHHHGPMLLSTATAFGPGYEHWMMTMPEPIEGSSGLFSMELIDRSHHARHHVAFVDKYIVHVPMYIPSLTLTYALWSNSKPTTWVDKLKRVKWIASRKAALRRLLVRLGLAKTLDLKPLEYLDYYPVEGGFKQLRNREDIEFKRGPVSDYLRSIFYVIQQTTGNKFADRIEAIVKAEPKLTESDRTLALDLVGKLKRNEEIEPRLTPGLHYGIEYANFTAERIVDSLAAGESRAAKPVGTGVAG